MSSHFVHHAPHPLEVGRTGHKGHGEKIQFQGHGQFNIAAIFVGGDRRAELYPRGIDAFAAGQWSTVEHPRDNIGVVDNFFNVQGDKAVVEVEGMSGFYLSR